MVGIPRDRALNRENRTTKSPRHKGVSQDDNRLCHDLHFRRHRFPLWLCFFAVHCLSLSVNAHLEFIHKTWRFEPQPILLFGGPCPIVSYEV